MKFIVAANEHIHLKQADYFGIIYLTLPLILFFMLYTITSIAIPSTLFLIYCITRLRISDTAPKTDWKIKTYNACIAAAVIILSGSTGPLFANSDWYKHFALFNEIANHSALGEPEFTLRYYIGAYIVPGIIEKFVSLSNGISISLWLWLGLVIFLNQLTTLIQSTALRYAAPLIFMLFSGADILGSQITGFKRGDIFHFEWWAGWIEYSSSMTSMFWAPQSTLPAWISIAFLVQRPTIEQKLFVSPLLFSACLLWSPFAAIGIAPFLLLTLAHQDFRLSKINFGHLFALGLIVLLLCYYLTFDTGNIPKNLAWNSPCLISNSGEPCFTWPNYAKFILIEFFFLALIALSFRPTRNAITYIAIGILLILPMMRLGLYNELAMNSSKPALGALIIAMILSLQDSNAWRRSFAALLLAAGIATPAGEIARAFKLPKSLSPDYDITTFVLQNPIFAQQYVTNKNIWFIRSEQ